MDAGCNRVTIMLCRSSLAVGAAECEAAWGKRGAPNLNAVDEPSGLRGRPETRDVVAGVEVRTPSSS